MPTRVTPYLGGTGQDNTGKINVHATLKRVSIGADILGNANLVVYGNSYANVAEGAATRFANATIFNTANASINVFSSAANARIDMGATNATFSQILYSGASASNIRFVAGGGVNNAFVEINEFTFMNNAYVRGNLFVAGTTTISNVIQLNETANTQTSNAYYLTKAASDISMSNGWTFVGTNVAHFAYGSKRVEYGIHNNTWVQGNVVVGGALFIGAGGAASYGPGAIYTDSNYGMLLRGRNVGTVAGAEFTLANSVDVHRFKIDIGGNVTVGPTHGAAKFNVTGNSFVSGNVVSGDLIAARNQLLIGSISDTNPGSSANLVMYSAGGGLMRLMRTGTAGDVSFQFASVATGDGTDFYFSPGTTNPATGMGYAWQTNRGTGYGANTAMVINRFGNVAIGGTLNPMSNLHVNGNAYVYSGYYTPAGLAVGNVPTGFSTSAGIIGLGRDLVGAATVTDQITFARQELATGIAGEGTGILWQFRTASGGYFQSRISSVVKAGNSGADILMSPGAPASAPAEIARFTNTGLGLWNTAPTSNLHVNGNAYVSGAISSSGNVTLLGLASIAMATNVTVGGDVNGSIEIGGVSKNPYMDFHSSASFNDYDSRIQATGGNTSIGGGTLTFTGNNFIFTGNRLGVGTTTPRANLDVNGNLHIGDGSARLDIKANSISAQFRYYNNGPMIFYTNDIQRMYFSGTAGMVKIGTGTPVANLDVLGNAFVSGDLSVNGLTALTATDGVTTALMRGATKGVRFTPSASVFTIEGVDNTGVTSYQPLTIGGSTLLFTVSATEIARLTNTGLGLWNPTPTSNLHVNGNAFVSSNVFSGGVHKSYAGTAVAAGANTQAFVTASNVVNQLGIFYGTGAPTFGAGKGSIYTRTDGTTTITRLYVNTDGSTTWTTLTTAA